jgi:membrane protein YqaA with SNARE-associated domain
MVNKLFFHRGSAGAVCRKETARENIIMTDDGPKPAPTGSEKGQGLKAILGREAEFQALEQAAPVPLRRRVRTAIVILETAFVLALVVIWLSNETIHHSHNLWVLFFYCFPSQFLLAALPHEPVVLYFGKFFSPLIVALVATAGTVVVEVINYSIFKYVADFKAVSRVTRSPLVVRFVNLFNKAPFLSLWVAGLTPVPFYPFRFLAVLARFPWALYVLAVLTSRFPRFFILAFLGNTLAIPNWIIIGLFAALVTMAVVPLIREFLRKERANGVVDQPDRF